MNCRRFRVAPLALVSAVLATVMPFMAVLGQAKVPRDATKPGTASERLLDNAMKAKSSGDDEPVTLKNSREILGNTIEIPFADKVPLEDFLKYLGNASSSKPLPRGIQFYLDPVGLRGTRKTLASPIQFSGRMSYSAAITKAMSQVGLAAYLGRHGEVLITLPSRAEVLLKESLLERATTSRRGKPQTAQANEDGPLNIRFANVIEALKDDLPMPFSNETQLLDLLKYAQTATSSNLLAAGIAIYCDPIGFREAGKTLASPIQLNMEGLPLATSLTMVLKQLGLTAYLQHEGLVIITTPARVEAFKARTDSLSDGTIRSLAPFTPDEVPAQRAKKVTPQQRETADRLTALVPMPFPKSTPIEDVFKHVEQVTAGRGKTNGLSIRMDPAALRKDPGLMSTPVVLNLRGFSLRTSLNLIASQANMDAAIKPDGTIVFAPRPRASAR